MSMALVLEYLPIWLRQKNGWQKNQCDSSYRGYPTADAGQFFVGVDEVLVETGNSENESLEETLTIQVSVWRRPEHLMHDRRNKIKDKEDRYLAGIYTLHRLERAVLVHGAKTGLNGLHNNYSFVNDLNTYFELPDNSLGDVFLSRFTFKGRGRNEEILVPTARDEQMFIGYTLRFSGLKRIQKIRNINHALG